MATLNRNTPYTTGMNRSAGGSNFFLSSGASNNMSAEDKDGAKAGSDGFTSLQEYINANAKPTTEQVAGFVKTNEGSPTLTNVPDFKIPDRTYYDYGIYRSDADIRHQQMLDEERGVQARENYWDWSQGLNKTPPKVAKDWTSQDVATELEKGLVDGGGTAGENALTSALYGNADYTSGMEAGIDAREKEKTEIENKYYKDAIKKAQDKAYQAMMDEGLVAYDNAWT